MKIIFLDIDGVITSPRVLSWYNFDIYAVNFLIWVCKTTGAKIVISSTWRHGRSKKFFEAIFKDCLHKDWKTPDWRRHFADARSNRGEEIDIWLNGLGDEYKDFIKHELFNRLKDGHKDVEQYIILDDDDDMLEKQKPFFIQTDSMNGLLIEDMHKIRKMFGIEDLFPKEVKQLHQHEYMFATYNLKR